MLTVRKRSAFTLAESLAASVILAVAVVGVSGALIASQQQSGVQRRTHVMNMLAEQLIERVAALPMQKADGTTGVSGWPSVTDANQYDTLDDFAGYTDTVDASQSVEACASTPQLITSNGADLSRLTTSQIPASGAYAVQRTVSISYPVVMFGMPVAAGDYALVKVTIRPASGESMSLTRIACRWTAIRSG